MKRLIKEWGFRKWYWYVSRTDKNADVIFMNYGYWFDDEQIPIGDEDEKNRVSIQLYHKLVSFIELEGLDICEIGSGRGGGLSYIHKNFNPNKTIGLDLNKRAIDFCNNFYKMDGLSFVQGDAQNLPFDNEMFDVVINTESSHRYPKFTSFLNETYRCLKPGGHLLLTDFRFDHEVEATQNDITNSDFKTIHQEIITQNVVNALKADDNRRRELVKKLVPKILHKTALNFAGAVGSDTFNKFSENKYVYFLYVLKKN